MEKKVTSTIFTISLLFMLGLFLPQGMQGQALVQSQILQKCIDYEGLQQYYPLDNQKNPFPVYVLESKPPVFPSNPPLVKFNKEVKYLSATELSKLDPESYFLFKQYDLKDNATTQVELEYYYRSNGNYKVLHGNFIFKNDGQTWKMSESKIN